MTPRTHLIGYTTVDEDGLRRYLSETSQYEFLEEWDNCDLASGEKMCSLFAKMCYRSLVPGKNSNVSKVRGIDDNIQGCFNQGHGSVFEHFWLNFITTGCSRVFTHELVRHRVGTAFSQTSGRYCTVEDARLVLPPETIGSLRTEMEKVFNYCKKSVCDLRAKFIDEDTPMGQKKKLTSLLRRIMPNGQDNEIAWSCNIRSVRHMIEMRTSEHAEWEIRQVFNDVASIIMQRWPLMLYGHHKAMRDSLYVYTNLKV